MVTHRSRQRYRRIERPVMSSTHTGDNAKAMALRTFEYIISGRCHANLGRDRSS